MWMICEWMNICNEIKLYTPALWTGSVVTDGELRRQQLMKPGFYGCAVGKEWLRFGFRFGFAKNWFSVQFYKINCSFIFSVPFFALCVVWCVCRAELVQLIVSWSDSKLEVQRYGMKKTTLAVDPIMLEDELWMRQREKLFPNHRSRFLKTELQKLSFQFFLILRSVRFGF